MFTDVAGVDMIARASSTPDVYMRNELLFCAWAQDFQHRTIA
jgi:hypothetical protein